MIISRTPFRISFVGGSTDIESFYKKHNGSVITSAIDKYMYVSLSEQFEKKIIFSYSKVESVTDASHLKHRILKETLIKYGINNNLEIHSNAEISTRGTGLGSSSSFTIGLLNCLFKHLKIRTSKKKLAEIACEIEINLCKFPIGKQDQYIIAYGGLRKFNFIKDGSVKVHSFNLDLKFEKYFFNSILLVYTGKSRSSSKVLTNLNNSINKNNNFSNKMHILLDLVKCFEKDLINQNISSMGQIISEGWNIKKNLVSNISNSNIDNIINIGIKFGSYGAKLLGAGGGGFVMFLSNSKVQKKLVEVFSHSIIYKVKIDKDGSKLIYN